MDPDIPEDKKKILTKEIKAVEEKLEVLGRFKSTVQVIVDLVSHVGVIGRSFLYQRGIWNAVDDLCDGRNRLFKLLFFQQIGFSKSALFS